MKDGAYKGLSLTIFPFVFVLNDVDLRLELPSS